MLRTILYSSAARRPMTADDLLDILETARKYNAEYDITGMLLYYRETFMQVLEGPDGALEELFHNLISTDDRHREVTMFLDEPIKERTFADWSMGFKNVDNIDVSTLPSYTSFLDEGFTSQHIRGNPSLAQRILLIFKDSQD